MLLAGVMQDEDILLLYLPPEDIMMQRQTAVAAYSRTEQVRLFAWTWHPSKHDTLKQ